MNGTGELVLYVDFDGVLHHENVRWSQERGSYLVAPPRYVLFQHVQLLEQLLAPHPGVRIVLSTTWALRYGDITTAERLSPGLQARVIGSTFGSRVAALDDFVHLPRGLQVTDDATRRRPRAWLALDDDGDGWPPEHAHRHVHTHMYEGVSDPAVQDEFKRKLEEMCQ